MIKIRNGELTEFKPDLMTIGVAPLKENAFRNNDIDTKPGDIFYLFSDGFSDQFGELTDKKFKHKYFKQLLESVAELPMEEQKMHLENAFIDWKGSVPQVDDVLVLVFNYNFFMMKLTAFRIRNFRSIVDTGWQNISPDNITCLIGQNESGKTSVLEGLKVFYSGIISEDVLRSDLSLPEIICRFTIPKGWLIKITDNPGSELKELLSDLDHLELTRSWIADFSSVIKVSGEISQYLDSLENAWRIYLDDVRIKLEEEMILIDELEESFKSC